MCIHCGMSTTLWVHHCMGKCIGDSEAGWMQSKGKGTAIWLYGLRNMLHIYTWCFGCACELRHHNKSFLKLECFCTQIRKTLSHFVLNTSDYWKPWWPRGYYLSIVSRKKRSAHGHCTSWCPELKTFSGCCINLAHNSSHFWCSLRSGAIGKVANRCNDVIPSSWWP